MLCTGPPIIQDNFLVKIEENTQNVTVDLRQEPAAFPEPTLFSWNKDGQPLTGRPMVLTYSNVTFDTVRRSDTGNYIIIFTRNLVLNDTMKEIGNDTESFFLTVICKFM